MVHTNTQTFKVVCHKLKYIRDLKIDKISLWLFLIFQCGFINKTSSQAPSYASPKLWITHWLTGVKCRATSVAKKWYLFYVMNVRFFHCLHFFEKWILCHRCPSRIVTTFQIEGNEFSPTNIISKTLKTKEVCFS